MFLGLEMRSIVSVLYNSIFYPDKTIPWRATSRDNYHTTALWFAEWVPEYLLRREFNIGGIRFQSDVARYYDSSRTNMSVHSILRRARPTRKKRRKKIRDILPFSGSLILTTMTPAVRELTWTRKFPLQRTGNIFQRPAKPLQIHAVYDITASGESFVARLDLLVQRNNTICDMTF